MGKVVGMLGGEQLGHHDIVELLSLEEGEGKTALFEHAARVKEQHVGRKVYLRGLIEMSNICSKNCFYCGIRLGNPQVKRYNLSDDEVVEAAQFAWSSRYASIVIQSGEVSSPAFAERVAQLLQRIHAATNRELGITLSLGEQPEEAYRLWFAHGATRYLLRIETSSPELYRQLHPDDGGHRLDTRVECLRALRRIGYQVGTGVMIGLPFQTLDHLAADLLWLKALDADMVGMGPYVEHPDTPLYKHRHLLRPLKERFDLSLKMIATLRVMMRDINIAAPTALQAIDPLGREKGIMVGANVVMPNITPGLYRNHYKLYDNKPCVDESAEDCKHCLEARITLTGDSIGWDEQGNSKHFGARQPR